MTRNTRWIGVLLLGFVFTTATAQSKYPSVLWEIKKNSSSAPSFLLGTYHLSSKGVFKFGDSLLWAMKKVDVVGTELNMGHWQKEDNRLDKYSAAYNLYAGKFTPQPFSQTSLQKTNTVEKLPEFIQVVPNFINYFLYRNNPASEGLEEEAYLDRFVASLGYKLGKQVVGLEDLVSSKVLEIEGIKNEAAAEKKEEPKLPDGLTMQDIGNKIYDGYLNNNLDALDSFLVYEHSKEYGDKFIVARNYVQADSMLTAMNQGKTIFAAVGCSHLVGEEGIINILRKKGYTLRPIKLNGGNDKEAIKFKEQVFPTPLYNVNVFDNISCAAPGAFYPYYATPVYKSAGHIDFANGAFYVVEKLVNNGLFYGYPEAKMVKAIDSLLYANIRGNIIKKEIAQHKGYRCLDVVCIIKNKDIERYKFIVTPYEIIKIKVGGKNEFAYNKWVDSFFNSIDIRYPVAVTKQYGFKVAEQYPLYAILENNDEYFEAWQRFVHYDNAKRQMNVVNKVKLHYGDIVYDSIMDVVVADSYFSSSLFPKKNRHQLFVKNKVQQLTLLDKRVMQVKYELHFPYVYIISSLADSGNADQDFVRSFAIEPLQYENLYSYVDSAKHIKMRLPYRLELQADLKKVRDRKVKKTANAYNYGKTNNDAEVYNYQPNMYSEDYEKDMIEFEDKKAMENTFGNIIYFDSAAHLSSAAIFWKQLLWPSNKNSSGSGSDNSDYVSTTSSSNSPFRFNVRNNKIVQLQLDTASNVEQTASFWAVDTIGNKKVFYKYMLFDDKVIELFAYGSNNELRLSSFAKTVFDNLAPIDSKKPAQVYANDFTKLLDGYAVADMANKKNLLKKLNHCFLQAKDIATIDGYFAKLNPDKAADNIIKRKLMTMMAKSVLAKEQWPQISAWLKKIFQNEKEALTMRATAAQFILEKQSPQDVDWVLEHVYRPSSPFREFFMRDLLEYLQETYPKDELHKKVQLTSFMQKNDLSYTRLIDSGYGNKKELAAAFVMAKQYLGGTEMATKIAAEKQLFTFEKPDANSMNKDNDNRGDRAVVRLFTYFFKHFPEDNYFDEKYKQFIKENNYRSLIVALEAMLKADKYPEAYINAGLKKMEEAKRYWPELNSLFYQHKKYEKLPPLFKDKHEIAKYLLADKERYNPSDSIVYIKTVKHPYRADSVFFYYYVKNKAASRKLAFFICKSDQALFGKKEAYEYEFTDERYGLNDNIDDSVMEILKKQYVGKYVRGGGYNYSGKALEKELYSSD